MSAGFLNPGDDLGADLVFSRSEGMSAGLFSPDAGLGSDLVFRVAHQDSPQLDQERGPSRREVVLRDVPWETVERRPGLGRLRSFSHSLLLDPVRRDVLGIPPPPRRLRR